MVLVLAAGMIIPAFNMKTMSSRHYGTTGLMQQIRQGIIIYEEEFGVNISDDESERLKTVGDAVKYIAAKL